MYYNIESHEKQYIVFCKAFIFQYFLQLLFLMIQYYQFSIQQGLLQSTMVMLQVIRMAILQLWHTSMPDYYSSNYLACTLLIIVTFFIFIFNSSISSTVSSLQSTENGSTTTTIAITNHIWNYTINIMYIISSTVSLYHCA